MLGEAGRYRRQQGGTGGSREVQEAAGRYCGRQGGIGRRRGIQGQQGDMLGSGEVKETAEGGIRRSGEV